MMHHKYSCHYCGKVFGNHFIGWRDHECEERWKGVAQEFKAREFLRREYVALQGKSNLPITEYYKVQPTQDMIELAGQLGVSQAEISSYGFFNAIARKQMGMT